MDICREKRPALTDLGDGHQVACFLCGSKPEEDFTAAPAETPETAPREYSDSETVQA